MVRRSIFDPALTYTLKGRKGFPSLKSSSAHWHAGIAMEGVCWNPSLKAK